MDIYIYIYNNIFVYVKYILSPQDVERWCHT